MFVSHTTLLVKVFIFVKAKLHKVITLNAEN